jgi:branched-chain amino acid aminotransferase
MSSKIELPDPRNEDILVHVAGRLVHRREASVSVFDSVVQGGDAVWEGLRVYKGRIAELDAHLDRLYDSAHALAFENLPPREAVLDAIFETLKANGMDDECHIRLTLTRGEKITSGMDPRNNRSGCNLIVLAEWKAPVYPAEGIRLVTASIRRNSPQILDSKIHHNNILNNILAKIEANVAGADDAIMLDLYGFVAETNATNVFLVREGTLLTPHADACLPGITRGLVIRLAKRDGIPTEERNVSLTEVYTADEVFTTGTMGELTPVLEVDGREIVNKVGSGVTNRLRGLHAAWVRENGYPIP